MFVSLLIITVMGAVPAEQRMAQAYEGFRTHRALQIAERVLADADASAKALEAARLIRALALWRLSHDEEALAAFNELAARGPDLGSYLPYLQVDLVARGKDCSTAADFAEHIAAASIFKTPALTRVGLCQLRIADFKAAMAVAQKLASLSSTEPQIAAAMAFRARVLEASEQRAAAIALYQEVLRTYRTTSAARSAQIRLEKLQGRDKSSAAPPPDEMLRVADAARARQRNPQARRLYYAIKRATRGRAKQRGVYQQAELGLIELDIVDRAYGRALRRLQPLAGGVDDADVKSRALFLTADVLARRKKLEQSLQTYARVWQELPDHPFAQEAMLAAADLAYNGELWQKTRELAAELLRMPTPRQDQTMVRDDGVHRQLSDSGSVQDRAHWLLAWTERRTGGSLESIQHHLAQIDRAGPLGNAATYWGIRFASETENAADLHRRVAALWEHSPTSYYGLMALDFLAQSTAPSMQTDPINFPSLRVLTQTEAPEFPNSVPPDLRAPMAMYRHGLKGAARSFLANINLGEMSNEARVAASWLYRQLGSCTLPFSIGALPWCTGLVYRQ
ncbi:MAG: hypothetical protein R3C68_11785 [Myxococcota bacterium]